MKPKWVRWMAAFVLSAGAAMPALAGSVTRPGDTLGAAMGMPAPQGWYFIDGTTYECRDTSPESVCALVNVPIVAWVPPVEILGGQLQLSTAPIVGVRVRVTDTATSNSLFNPYVGAQLAWNLGDDWGASYLVGAYFETGGETAYSSTSLNQRASLSYTGNQMNLTATAVLGTHFDSVTDSPQGSPCPVTADHPHSGCNPDFLNVDVTATKRFQAWELGAVGVFSTDLNHPIPEYAKQSQVQLGGLVAHYYGQKAILQAIVTANVYHKNYGASIVSGTLRLIIPLGNPRGPLRPIAP